MMCVYYDATIRHLDSVNYGLLLYSLLQSHPTYLPSIVASGNTTRCEQFSFSYGQTQISILGTHADNCVEQQAA
jgi:hypothetical protein